MTSGDPHNKEVAGKEDELELDDLSQDTPEFEDNINYQLFEHKKMVVDPGQNSMRIDLFLPHHFGRATRSKIKKAADLKCLKVNGEVVKPSYKVKPGDKISLFLPYPPPPDMSPENIPVDVIYEDERVMIVNKPAGMVVHPGVGNWTGTLIQALLYYTNKEKIEAGEDITIYPGLVHRIDKDTSGLLCVGKDEDTVLAISQQFYEKTTDRIYHSIVWGDVKEDAGRIVMNIIRDPSDRKKYRAIPEGEEGRWAATNYKVIERFGFATHIQCKLETGRTHQIRVHLKALGHVIFGDRFYGGEKTHYGPKNKIGYRQFIKKCMQVMRRQALHARTLGFNHPGKGERMHFNSELPADFVNLIELLRNYVQENS